MFKMINYYLFAFIAINGDANDRYKGYKFKPDDSKVERDVDKPNWLSEYIPEWQVVMPKSFLEVSGSQFFLFEVKTPRDKRTIEKFNKKKKEYLVGNREVYFNSSWNSAAVMHDNNVEFLHGPGLVFSTGHRGHDYFGCIESRPLFEVSMIEGVKNAIWIITGKGDELHYDGVNENIKVTVYDGETTQKYFEYYAMMTSYTNKPWKDFDFVLGATRDRSSPLFNDEFRGKKLFAKAYINDFDNNDKLDVVIWHRQYYSTRVSDKDRKGFTFEKEWFTRYEENKKHFFEKELTIDDGRKLLGNAGLTWKDGFPRDNRLCEEKKTSIPMMPRVIDSGIAY
ncbi:hypothetical protein [Pleionea mediterranea]|uniref:Uncharacterized protein n=1 Tax=Pleionea mediterranea TaxID=523701 RepID=A0A316FUH1_9GAMM|nr:hypothetical protein [Pleionea mediterranea]PWK51735.1 hypothetical protein C8D97_10550 [Pleionea mediterranea]